MEYIIFLITIQIPFLYLIWKFFQQRNLEAGKNMRALKKQTDYIANFMNTLKMTVEKISEDIYENGKINSRIFQIEKDIKDLKTSFRQMELYTGLRTSEKTFESLSSSSKLKEKDFR